MLGEFKVDARLLSYHVEEMELEADERRRHKMISIDSLVTTLQRDGDGPACKDGDLIILSLRR